MSCDHHQRLHSIRRQIFPTTVWSDCNHGRHLIRLVFPRMYRLKLRYFDLLHKLLYKKFQLIEVVEFGIESLLQLGYSYRVILLLLFSEKSCSVRPLRLVGNSFPVNKSVTSWREQKSVVSVVSCRFPNSITTTCCGLVCSVANKTAASL